MALSYPSTTAPAQQNESSTDVDPEHQGDQGGGPPTSPPESPREGWWMHFKKSVKRLKSNILALYYAAHHPDCGILPRIIAAVAVAYALSPIDLIPDFIPVLGLLDDLIILPGLVWLAVLMIPAHVWAASKERAANEPLRLSQNWIAAAIFFALWDLMLGFATLWLCRKYGGANPWVSGRSAWVVAGGVVGVLVVGEVIFSVCHLMAEREKKNSLGSAGEGGGTVHQRLLAEGEGGV